MMAKREMAPGNSSNWVLVPLFPLRPHSGTLSRVTSAPQERRWQYCPFCQDWGRGGKVQEQPELGAHAERGISLTSWERFTFSHTLGSRSSVWYYTRHLHS